MRRIALLFLIPLSAASLAACGAGSAGSATTTTRPPVSEPPVVSAAYGSSSTITFPSPVPQKTFEAKVLDRGTGSVVAKGDLLVANYVGQIWAQKVFDSSFARHTPAAFPIGVGQVVPGWDKGLVGQTIGSRILLVLPPADGYGAQGNTQAGIKGTDTLVFVVDLLGAYSAKVAGDPAAVPQKLPAGLPVIHGALGVPPTMTIPKGLKAPKKEMSYLVAKGHGAIVQAGMVVLQYVIYSFAGKFEESTWQKGIPDGEVIGSTAQPSVLDKLMGLTVGSRVLLELPAGGSNPAVAVSVDIVAQPS
ncbi:MAG TPA: FKBP-type peptidyl-prolyl cis-trans isomerase [Acidimicrobiales bacterium]|nr:FKBP-type peptidyl-prolyl cis-trans isomerase [Acidimicrobiales bacterium]